MQIADAETQLGKWEVGQEGVRTGEGWCVLKLVGSRASPRVAQAKQSHFQPKNELQWPNRTHYMQIVTPCEWPSDPSLSLAFRAQSRSKTASSLLFVSLTRGDLPLHELDAGR